LILADTSVWIEFFSGKNRLVAEHLADLLDADRVLLAAPVKIQILSGTSPAMFLKLKRVLSALPIYYPRQETWRTIDAWLEEGIRKGERFGFGDLLIAAIGTQQIARIWSLDSDFARMQKLGWIELYRI
jgi:predicted nucleic acid-binding protein